MKNALPFLFIIISFFILNAENTKFPDFPFELNDTKEAFIFSAGLGFSTSFLVTPSTYAESDKINNLNKYQNNAFDRIAVGLNDKDSDTASDVLAYSLAAAPVFMLADRRLNKNILNSFTYFVMYAESAFLANGISRTLKTIFKRKRPYVYNSSLSLSERTQGDWNLSFPSNHTVNSFNAAVFISTVFTIANPGSKWTPVIWTVSLSAATTVGILRVTAGKHFPTDVIAGAILGSLTGAIVPLLHIKKKKDLAVYPVFSDSYSGIDFTLNY